MQQTKRTPRQTAKVIAQTIAEIPTDKKEVNDELITELCTKNNISEQHIKTILGRTYKVKKNESVLVM